VKVPSVVGRQQAAAQRTLVRAGLRSRVTYVTAQQPQGTVVSQTPTAGTTVRRGTRVGLKVSTGPSAPQQTAVPDVTGEDQATATSDLQNAGFQVQVVEQDTTDPSQDGIVLDQDPAGGSQAPQGATVTIVVGRSTSGG
jgi:serine/threonine-protein kinase